MTRARQGRSRDELAATLAVDWLRAHPLAGRLLAVDDATGRVEAALGRPEAWRRSVRGERGARAWPPDGPFDGATVRLPRAREALAMSLHAVAARLAPGGALLLYGANDEGIRSAGRRLAELYTDVETLDARRHCRLWRARRAADAPPARGALEDWCRRFAVDLGAGPVELCSFPGVFSHGKLDAGSRLLIESLAGLPALPAGGRALDFACGAGVLARALRERDPGASLELCDVDALALEAARRNVPGAALHLGDGWSALPATLRYSLVVSNPPLHQGAERDVATLRALVDAAPGRLETSGILRFVTRRALAVAPLLEGRFRRVEVAREDSRYRVWSCAR